MLLYQSLLYTKLYSARGRGAANKLHIAIVIFLGGILIPNNCVEISTDSEATVCCLHCQTKQTLSLSSSKNLITQVILVSHGQYVKASFPVNQKKKQISPTCDSQ